MRKSFKISLSILICISGFLSLTITFIAVQKWCLEYNSEGRFFDPTEAIVYDMDGRLLYTLLSIVFCLITYLLSFILYHANRN